MVTKPRKKSAKASGNGTAKKTEVAKVEEGLPAEAAAGIDAYLEVAAAESASYLKFAKGEWLVGVDETEVEPSTEVVPYMLGITSGHAKWADRQVIDERMTPIIDGPYEPREALGDLDRDLWDIDDNGTPKDPWSRTMRVPIKRLDDGEQLIFSTSSKGGIRAVNRLISQWRAGQRKGQTGHPPQCP